MVSEGISQDAVNAQKHAPYIAGDEIAAHTGPESDTTCLLMEERAVNTGLVNTGLVVGKDLAIDSHSSTHGTASSARSQKDHLPTPPHASACQI